MKSAPYPLKTSVGPLSAPSIPRKKLARRKDPVKGSYAIPPNRQIPFGFTRVPKPRSCGNPYRLTPPRKNCISNLCLMKPWLSPVHNTAVAKEPATFSPPLTHPFSSLPAVCYENWIRTNPARIVWQRWGGRWAPQKAQPPTSTESLAVTRPVCLPDRKFP